MRAEKATFYTSPAVMPDAEPGSGEGLSDGPHQWSCAADGKGHGESLWVF